MTRPGITAQIEEVLRASPRTLGAVTVSALQGIPGAGKTTIAAYLARTLAVRQWFADGILWLTLGPHPGNLRDLAGGIIQAFDRSYQPRELQTTLGRLKELLRPKRCLLILDDVWDPAHARPLLPDGERCKVLITTRDAALARELGARILPVDVLDPDEALTLLSEHSGQALSPHDQAVAREISADLGFHPLALHLAGVQIAAGVSWTELRDGLRDETRQLLVLEPSDDGWSLGAQPTNSILASFELSARRLDQNAHRAFAWLGVLQHTSLEAEFLTTLWSMDRPAAERLLRHLAAKGFLTEIRSEATAGKKYELHALLHRFARRLLLRTLGGTLAQAHGAFLDRYDVAPGGKGWFDVTDDGYIYEQLAWHLKSADRLEELFDLLRAETPDGTHQWYAACERYGKSAAFLATVRDARRAARERYELTRRPADAGVVLRCILLASTSNSVGLTIRSDLLVALAKAGLWSLDQALTRVRQRQDRDVRISTLLRLIEQFPEEIRDDVRLEVLEELSSVAEILDQQQLVARLAPHVAGRPAMIDKVVKLLLRGFVEPNWIRAVTIVRRFAPREAIEALARVRPIDPDKSWRAWRAVVFSASLGGWSVQQARDTADQIAYPHQRALALMAIAETLPEQPVSLIRAAIQAFAQDDGPFDELEVIRAIGPYATLSADLLAALWKAVRRPAADGEYSNDLSHAIAALAPYLVGHESVVDEALAVARAFVDPHARAVALAGLSDVVGPDDHRAIIGELDALANAAIGTGDAHAILVAIAERQVTTRRDELLRRALQLSMAPDDGDIWLTALNRAVRASPKALQSAIAREAIDRLRPVTGGSVPKVTMLIELLPAPDREVLVAEMRAAIEGLPSEQSVYSLAALASVSAARRDVLLREAIDTIAEMPAAGRADVLVGVAQYIATDGAATQRAVRILTDLPPSAEVLRAALPLLPSCSVEERIAFVRALTERTLASGVESWAHSELATLATFGAHDPSALQQMTDTAIAMNNAAAAAALCVAIAALPGADKAEACIRACWARTGSIGELQRRTVRLKLLPLLPAPDRAAAFEQTWDEYDAEQDAIDRAHLRSQLLVYAPREQLSTRIASLLPALTLNRSEEHHEDYQASTLIGIAQSNAALDVSIVAALETRARAMHDPHNRAVSLAVLIRYLDPVRGESAFDAAVDAARLIDRLDYRSLVFVDFLLPVCPLPRRPAFVVEALRVVIRWGRMDTGRVARLIDELLVGNDDALWAAWGELEEELSNQSRATVLQFVAHCGALLDRLFGEDGAAAISQAVLDVGRWFPPKRTL